MLAPHLAEQLHEAARLINTAAGPRGGQHRPDQLDTAASLSRQFPDRQLASATTQTLEQVHTLRDDLSALWDQVASDVQPAVVQDHSTPWSSPSVRCGCSWSSQRSPHRQGPTTPPRQVPGRRLGGCSARPTGRRSIASPGSW